MDAPTAGTAVSKRAGGGLRALDLGLAEYPETLALQHRLREQRLSGAVEDTLLLLEHPPLFTCGRGSLPQEFLLPQQELQARGFGIHSVERGGKTTYHGPGQLMGYPIISLQERGLQAREYVALLEQCLIDSLADFGLVSARRAGYPGVWVQERKIAALGVHIKQGVSIHGFALNLNPDLNHFAYIVPCGIPDGTVTSMQAELGRSPAMAVAKASVEHHLRRVFGYAHTAHIPADAT